MTGSVCILTTVHPPFDPRIFHKEAQSLCAAGYTVTLIAQHDRREDVRAGIRIIGLPPMHSRWGRPLNWLRLLRLTCREKADIYHFHDPELLPWALLIRWLTKRPVLYDVHEHYPDTILLRRWIPLLLRVLVSRVFDWLERTLSSGLDAIIVADDDVERRFNSIAKRLIKLYNFPLKASYEALAASPSTPAPKPRPVQLVYTGLISSPRGLSLMLDAFSLLLHEHHLDVGLWLAGPMDSRRDHDEFQQQLHGDPALAERVQWLGRLPYEAIPPLLRAATIGWVPFEPHPKFTKNIPTKQFEYMACSLPIVGSDLPPIRQFVESSQAGLLAIPGDPSSHAEKIAYLVQHPEEARQMGENGRRAFETRYNWGGEAEKLTALYSSLLNQDQRQ